MGVTLGGLPCVDPTNVIRYCSRKGLPLDWAGLPNRFVTILGPDPGRGWLLMHRGNVNQLNRNSPMDLVFGGGNGDRITLKNLVFVRARCVTPGKDGDVNAVYLIEVRDLRHFAQNEFYGIPINQQYNVIAPDGGAYPTYYASSLNAGSPYTWQTMLDSLWATIGVSEMGSSPSLPFTPDGVPTNFKFVGVPAWQAYNEVLERLGCAFTPYPSTASVKIVQYGAANAFYAGALQTYRQYRITNADVIESDAAKAPAFVRVYFHVAAKHYGSEATTSASSSQWSTGQVYNIVVGAPSGTVTRSGAEVAIWDDLPAVQDFDGTLTNSAALTSRATERANDYYRQLSGTILQIGFQRIIDDVGFGPNEQVSGIAWLQVGNGFGTEISRLPPPVQITDNGRIVARSDKANERLKPPDLGRVSVPNYPEPMQLVKPTAVTAETQVYDSVVQLVNPTTKAVSTSEACWLYSPNRVLTPSDGLYFESRLNGTHSVGGVERPLYLTDAGAAGGGTTGISGSAVVVKVTSSTPSNGFYPAVLESYNTATQVWTDLGAVLAQEPNGAILVQNFRYPNVFSYGTGTTTQSGSTTTGSVLITGLGSTSGLAVGEVVQGAGIPAGAVVANIVSSTSININNPATATATITVTFILPVYLVIQGGVSVKVVSTSGYSDRWTAKMQVYNSTSRGFANGPDCWADTPNGETLVVNNIYPNCAYQGTDGASPAKAVYLVNSGGQSLTVQDQAGTPHVIANVNKITVAAPDTVAGGAAGEAIVSRGSTGIILAANTVFCSGGSDQDVVWTSASVISGRFATPAFPTSSITLPQQGWYTIGYSFYLLGSTANLSGGSGYLRFSLNNGSILLGSMQIPFNSGNIIEGVPTASRIYYYISGNTKLTVEVILDGSTVMTGQLALTLPAFWAFWHGP